MGDYVHGETDAAEIARLQKQAVFTLDFSLPLLPRPFAPGARVLDLATGVGATALELTRRWPGLHVIGVDLSKTQLDAARQASAQLPLIHADATRLPVAPGVFDVVHCTWLLEHVRDPVAILREVKRVLKPGGFCQFVEVENDTFSTDPVLPAVAEALRRLNVAQRAGGGDPNVGAQLRHHFRAAGFRCFTVQPRPLRGAAGDSGLLGRMIDEFAEIFEGLTKTVAPAERALMHRAAAELRTLSSTPHARLHYTPVVAHGFV